MASGSRCAIWRMRFFHRVACGALIAAALLASGCGTKKKTLGLDVDLYLHATSADATDILLQTGISKRLAESDATRSARVHVRVTAGGVALTGAVRNRAVSDAAERIAKETELTLNGASIRPVGEIRNQLDIEP